ncbi:MAG: TetR/AcrR family transcriptional regulator [Lachnospiraceae bacterium]
MPKGSPELTSARKNEIMNACGKLYQKKIFKEITLQDISKETSFTRTSIYNYYESKEEIFLGLFEREYNMWTWDIEKLTEEITGISREELALEIAGSLQKRKLLLKLLSVNLYDLEENSRMERLVNFKAAYGNLKKALWKLISKCYPGIKDYEIKDFIRIFLPYLHGIYPYTYATDKQIEAMDRVGIEHEKTTIKDLVYMGLIKILP